MNTALTISRLATFGAVTMLIGTLCFIPFVWPDGYRSRRLHSISRWALAGAGIATVLGMALYGPYAAGRSFGSVTDLDLFTDALQTKFGIASMLRLALFCALAALIWPRRHQPFEQAYAMSLVGLLVVVAFTMSLAGHASTKGAVPMAADMIHLLAAGFWIGGIVTLYAVVLPHRPAAELATVVPAFSRLAFWSIVVLAITGSTQALVQLGGFDVLGHGAYGKLLVTKLVVFAVILWLGAMSKRWVRRRYVPDLEASPQSEWPESEKDAHFRAGLRKSVGAELVVAAMILGVTAALVNSSPIG